MTRMKIDYTDPLAAPNWRDVGLVVNLLGEEQGVDSPRLLQDVLYRGGTIRYIRDLEVIGNPSTVFNLRIQRDRNDLLDVKIHHFAIDNTLDVYDTANTQVRKWLRWVLGVLSEGVALPLYLHCHSGIDRTGVVVASLLSIIGIPQQVIVQEYLWGASKQKEPLIRQALAELCDAENYFSGIDLHCIRGMFA